jgi:two-component system, OmpR family, sensor histidine kinase VicK
LAKHGNIPKHPSSDVIRDRMPNKNSERINPVPAKKPIRQDDTNVQDAISVLWHELLTPLTLIKGYTSTLLEFSKAIPEEQKQQYLHGIESASNRMVRLLEDLRNINRLEDTEINTDHPISILELLRQSLAEMQNQTSKHVISFYPHAPLPRAKVDPDKILQVITNLLGNAIKYTPDGGDIEVELRLVRTSRELTSLFPDAPEISLPSLVISVRDNGIGLPDEALAHVFEKFYRANTKFTRSIPGAGLGLYICRLIIEAHNGRIWCRNRLQGVGSIFSFSIPVI